MRRLAIGVTIASLALVSGCGSDDPEPTETSGTDSSAPVDEETTDAAEETSEPAETDSASEATVLTAVVGTEADPDAFVITLTDDAGAPVTTLPAGDYEIQVSDLSAIHNFHLTGGDVDETTTVDEVTDVVWDVTLAPGDYTFKCDPHPPMLGEFTVT